MGIIASTQNGSVVVDFLLPGIFICHDHSVRMAQRYRCDNHPFDRNSTDHRNDFNGNKNQ